MCIPRGKDNPEAKNKIICKACAGALLVKVGCPWGCQSDPDPWAKLASQKKKPCQSAQQRPGCVQPSFLPVEKRGRDGRPVSRGSWAGLSASCSCPCAGHVCCGLPCEVSPQDFGCGAAAGVRRIQLPKTNVRAAGRKLEGSGRKVGARVRARLV